MDAMSSTSETNVDALLAELAALEIHLGLDGENLSIRGRAGALDAKLRGQLMACKPALMAMLRKHQAAAPAEAIASPQDRHAPFALTDIQQAYWIGRTDLAEHGSVMCHYYQEFESVGLDLDHLERAFRAVIARHDMLRAVVDMDGRQRILEKVPVFKFGRSDMRAQSPAHIERAIKTVRERMAYEVFDASHWPLFDIHAVVQDGGKLRLHLSFDLIMIDAESLSKLIWEWKRYYDQPEAAITPLTFSFRDYVNAEHALRESGSYRSSLAYWEGRIDDLPPAPALPRPRTPGRDNSKNIRTRRRACLPREVWAPLKEQAGKQGVTPSGLLCAVFAEVLGAWSCDPRFTLNVTFCDRRPLHADVAMQLGDFTTNILLETDTTPATFEARVRTIQAQLRRDLDHAQVSGVEVLRRLNRRRQQGSLATMPVVFTSLLGHRGDVPNVLFSSNWLGEHVYGISQTPQVSLDFQAYEEDGGVLLQWDAIEGDYPKGVLEDMFAAYRGLLERLSGDAALWKAANVLSLPVLQAKVRAEVNATQARVEDVLLHGLFEAQAAHRPNALAVISADRVLDYATLDRELLILAHSLIDRGARPGSHVAVVMEKGWQQVVAVLGILRACAAYLPIDPAVPEARLRYLLADGEASIALTQPDLVGRIVWPAGTEVLSVVPRSVDGEEVAPITQRQAPGDLAYTIFTSGSTGRPKGVMIDHRGAVTPFST